MVFLELFGAVEESNGTVPFGGLVIRDDRRRYWLGTNPVGIKQGERDIGSVGEIRRRLQEAATGISLQGEKSLSPKTQKNDSGNAIRKMINDCLLYTSPSPRDGLLSRMPSSA